MRLIEFKSHSMPIRYVLPSYLHVLEPAVILF